MRKERIAAAATVTTHLIEAERALDEALQKVAMLTVAMSSARISANLSAVIGHGAFSRITTATQWLGQARSEIALGHIELNQAKEDIGLREMNFGGAMGCPEKGAAQEVEVALLRAV